MNIHSFKTLKSAHLLNNLLIYLKVNWALTIGLFLAVSVRLTFWIYTDRTWEDALITTTHAMSAAEGIGLTHHAGEPPIHGFTSVLSVLIPLVAEVTVSGSGIFFLKLCSVIASVLTLIYAHSIGQKYNLDQWSSLFVLVFLACDYQHIFYGMAGMETQVAVAIIVAGAFYVINRATIPSGICLGLALLARPDFVLWVAPALFFLGVYNWKIARNSGIIAFLVTLPWLIFTLLYYGSPVPNPIKAKAGFYFQDQLTEHSSKLAEWMHWIGVRLDMHRLQTWKMLTPLYNVNSAIIIDPPIRFRYAIIFAFIFVTLALIGIWTKRRSLEFYPIIGYLGIYLVYRVLFVFPFYFDWYLPPFTAFLVLCAGLGIHRLGKASWQVKRGLAIVLSLAYAFHIPFTFPLEQRVQSIENQVRRPLGEYLGQVIQPGEAITSESSGYIGYYSRGLLWDFPGLTSHTSRQVLENVPPEDNNLYYLIAQLEPTWIVLRPNERDELARMYPEIYAKYRVHKHLKSEVDLNYLFMSYTSIDQEFWLMRRED
ncbi:hypothetical protein [Spirulina subsalsa]|uniref:hypothetical protein n=1 Tax=Spirulina subsalsa TaxID=54311 RepID=UPI0013E0BB60|nr:hypothetical protein [Spirulina subsalsa]